MPSLNTSALVIRRADYSDYDRMVTLFTPEYGRIDAICRGCRKPKSPLLNASEPFASGEFQLYQRGERFSIEQCQIQESFYELRTDYDRLVHGVYWLKLLDSCVMPDVPMPDLFLLTLRALAHLNYSDLPPELLTMAFEMHLMAQLGYAPRVDACQKCGRIIDGDARFDAERGGCVCLHCPSPAPLISHGARRIFLKLPRTRYDQVKLLIDHPDWQEAARLFRTYVDYRLMQQKFAPQLP
jgi:DNA repair protein RecO (recombination protein O)